MKQYLLSLFKQRKIRKTYLALVHGKLSPLEAKLNLPLSRNPVHRHKMQVSPKGKKAISFYKVIKQFSDFSLVEIRPITGRTHQIRAQFKYLGHPIFGDKIYGKKEKIVARRQFLHASKIEFKMPSGQKVSFKADLPPDLKTILQLL